MKCPINRCSEQAEKTYRVTFHLGCEQIGEHLMAGPRLAAERWARRERYYAFPGSRISVSTTGARARYRIERVA